MRTRAHVTLPSAPADTPASARRATVRAGGEAHRPSAPPARAGGLHPSRPGSRPAARAAGDRGRTRAHALRRVRAAPALGRRDRGVAAGAAAPDEGPHARGGDRHVPPAAAAARSRACAPLPEGGAVVLALGPLRARL